MTKRIIQICIAVLLLIVGYKLSLPWEKFPFEHYEYQIANLLPLNWKLISVVSRLIVGLIFMSGFYLLLKNKKVKFLKYLSIFALSIPFILNPVFPENWKNESPLISETPALESNILKENNIVLLAYFIEGCRYCKESINKLEAAKKKSKYFPKLVIVSYDLELQNYFEENNYDFPIEIMSKQELIQTARGAFPHFQLVKNNTLIYNWNNYQFNYEVLDLLSNE